MPLYCHVNLGVPWNANTFPVPQALYCFMFQFLYGLCEAFPDPTGSAKRFYSATIREKRMTHLKQHRDRCACTMSLARLNSCQNHQRQLSSPRHSVSQKNEVHTLFHDSRLFNLSGSSFSICIITQGHFV